MDSATVKSTTVNTDETSDDSTTSPPPKKAKHLEVPQLETTSINAALNGAEHLQQSTNSKETTEQQPLDDDSECSNERNPPPKKRIKIQPQNDEPRQPITKNGIYDFCLPLERESDKTPQGNLEPDSAGSEDPRASGVWHKSLEEAHSAQIRERSLLGHIQWSGDNQQILESDIFRILKSEGVKG